MNNFFRKLRTLPKRQKLIYELFLIFIILICAGIILAAVIGRINPLALTNSISNTALLSYQDSSGNSHSISSNTILTTIFTPSPSPSPITSPTSSSKPIESPSPSTPTPSPSVSPTAPPQLSVSESPTNPNRFTYVSLTAQVANDPNHWVKTIKIYLDNRVVKTCTASSCVYTKKMRAGDHTYYAITTGYVLRTPPTGTYSFYVNK